MKKSIVIFVLTVVLAVGMVSYGWAFVDGQIGEAVLTEETISGNREAAEGLTVGFRADSADNLHWINSFDYDADESKSTFIRGGMPIKTDTVVYDDIRFNGWSAVSYCTELKYDRLGDLQERGIHAFYDDIQQRVMKTGETESGKIKLKDYLDFYPVSFRFQLGTKVYSSDNALTGLKVYDERDMLFAEKGAAYDEDVDLYAAFNNLFKIPIIDNEYHEYTVSKKEKYNREIALGYRTDVKKSLGEGEDFYEFDPLIVIQEENIIDGKRWYHPDVKGGLSYEIAGEGDDGDEAGGDDAGEGGDGVGKGDDGVGKGDEAGGSDAVGEGGDGVGKGDEAGGSDAVDGIDDAGGDDAVDGIDDAAGKTAADYGLKNRMLFAVNNRTAKGVPVDVSQISDGYGIYEMPIVVAATATVKRGPKSFIARNPKPVAGEMKMVYPLSENDEYVEMSLSGDHRYLAVFSVKEGAYFVDMIDADKWTSRGKIELFPASEKMSYAWGEEGSLAVTNHQGYISVLSRTESAEEPYEVLYSGKVTDGLDRALFDTEMVVKDHSYSKYKYCIDRGLVVKVKDGKAALVQNLLAGEGDGAVRNAALECAIIDETGVIYRGRIKNSVVDLDYDTNTDIKIDSKSAELMIKPVRNENWAQWCK